jgi:transposase
MNIRISVNRHLRKELLNCLTQAVQKSKVRLAKRIMVILDVLDAICLEEIAERLMLDIRTVRNYVLQFILHGTASLAYARPPGRPPKLTKSQRKELCRLLDAGPEAAGYQCGCWTTALIQQMIEERFRVEYNIHYVAELLKTLNYSYQKARFVSDHLEQVAEKQAKWMNEEWPALLHQAQAKGAMILFGDEASFAQWGSLSYTWSRKGEQPLIKTSGKRRSYKVMGLIDYVSGAFFFKTMQQGRFNSDTYKTFLTEVLAKASQPLILIQDGARYHTSKAMQDFFANHVDRLTVHQLPAYSPEFNPIEFLWRNIKKQATHLRYFPTFEKLTQAVDEKLKLFADLPDSILALMGRYRSHLGTVTT